MKRVKLYRAIQLPDEKKTVLKPGEHDITDELFSHWFIKGLIETGGIEVMDTASSRPVLKQSGEKQPQKILPSLTKSVKDSSSSVGEVNIISSIKKVKPMRIRMTK